jgi:hypothetical protein
MDDSLTHKEPTMYSHFLFLALDTARERAAEADRHRLAAAARRRPLEDRPAVGRFRRLIARAAMATGRLADDDTSLGRGDGVAEAPRLRLRSES